MRFTVITLILFLCSMAAGAAESSVEVHALDSNGIGQLLGTVTLKDTPNGIELAPALHGLPARAATACIFTRTRPVARETRKARHWPGLAAGSQLRTRTRPARHLGPEVSRSTRATCPC